MAIMRRQVAGVTVFATADIDDDGIPMLQLAAAGVVVRESAVGAGADNGEFRFGAIDFVLGMDGRGDLQLADAGFGGRIGGLHGPVVDQRIFLELGKLLGILAHAQRTERRIGELVRGARQPIEQQQSEIGTHGFVEHDVFGRTRSDICKGRIQCTAGTIGIVPGVHADIGMFAAAFKH